MKAWYTATRLKELGWVNATFVACLLTHVFGSTVKSEKVTEPLAVSCSVIKDSCLYNVVSVLLITVIRLQLWKSFSSRRLTVKKKTPRMSE